MLAVLVGLIYAEDGNEVVVGSDEGLKGVKSNIDKGYLTNFNDNGKIYMGWFDQVLPNWTENQGW